MKNINVEVEGGELAIKNSFGDIAIIPKRYKLEVETMVEDECWECIDGLVSTLPILTDYAKDGSLIPEDDEVKKKKILDTYPTLRKVYGENGENLEIHADTNFKAFEYGYGGIEYFSKGSEQIDYNEPNSDIRDPKKVYKNPSKSKTHSILYYPKEFTRHNNEKVTINDQDIYLDLLHGMPEDSTYNALRGEFKDTIIKERKEDINYFYNRDLKGGQAQDGYDRWVDNYVDGELRATQSEGNPDYDEAKKYHSESLTNIGNKIKNYMRTGNNQDLPLTKKEKKNTENPDDENQK